MNMLQQIILFILILIAVVGSAIFVSNKTTKKTSITAEQIEARDSGTPLPFDKLPSGNYEVRFCVDQKSIHLRTNYGGGARRF